jgi:hypothetical protein
MADDFNQLMRPGIQAASPPPNPLGPTPSLADAWSYNTQAAQDWINQQRAISAQQGLWGPQGITPAGVVNAAQQTAQGIMMGTTAPGDAAPGFTAYHGSPHSFDAFDTSKIGTGEGVQAYGHGLYTAGNEAVAQSYKMAGPAADAQVDAINTQLSQLSKQMDQYSTGQYGKYNDPKGYELKAQYDALMEQRTNLGHMYEVQVNADPAHFLDWDKPLSEQSQHVQGAVRNSPELAAAVKYGDNPTDPTGQQIHKAAVGLQMRRQGFGESQTTAAQQLHAAGIPGIRYLDQGSRAAGEGTSNHVIFDANTIAILRKYGIAGLMAGGGAAAAGTQQQQPSQ